MKSFLLPLLTLTFTCHGATDLSHLIVPKGFNIEVFAENIDNPRQMALSDSGVIYVGSRRAGNVYALVDENNDGKADKQWLVAEYLQQPSGLAVHNGDLYVADINKILKFSEVDQQIKNLTALNKKPQKAKYSVIFDGLPDDSHHGWKFIRFNAKGELIIPVGAPCNICEPPTQLHSTILSLDLSRKTLTTLASGVRNSVGFDFHPSTGKLWFSDNGTDMMGDDIPPDEINRISKIGQHFGYPYFHAGTIADPKYAKGKTATDYVQPELSLGAHVAPLGIHFYLGKQFPTKYQQQLFVAEHGSWNRSKKVGYRVNIAFIKDDKIVDYQPFVTGFMRNEKTIGRPAAILELRDGSLLISDDFANMIYRVSYSPHSTH